MLSCFEPVSYEAIRKWYHKAHSMFSIETTYHEVIGVDETKVKINDKLYILWAAVDTRTWEVLGI